MLSGNGLANWSFSYDPVTKGTDQTIFRSSKKMIVVILQIVLMPFYTSQTDIKPCVDLLVKGEYFIKQLNCTNRQAVTTLECLQQIEDWRTIRDVDMSKFGSDFSPIWGPVLDGEMVSADTPPLEKMKTGEYLNYEVRTNQIPLIRQ